MHFILFLSQFYIVAIVTKSPDAQMHTSCTVLINHDALSKNEISVSINISLLETDTRNKIIS